MAPRKSFDTGTELINEQTYILMICQFLCGEICIQPQAWNGFTYIFLSLYM